MRSLQEPSQCCCHLKVDHRTALANLLAKIGLAASAGSKPYFARLALATIVAIAAGSAALLLT